MSTVGLIFLVGLVKGFVDGIKWLIKSLDADEPVRGIDHFWAKTLAVILSTVFVLGYKFNLPASLGEASGWPLLDYVATILTVALLSMNANDIGNIWGAAGKAR